MQFQLSTDCYSPNGLHSPISLVHLTCKGRKKSLLKVQNCRIYTFNPPPPSLVLMRLSLSFPPFSFFRYNLERGGANERLTAHLVKFGCATQGHVKRRNKNKKKKREKDETEETEERDREKERERERQKVKSERCSSAVTSYSS